MPSGTRVARGFTVYFDFGVTLTFSDGSRWSSDIQRMGYVLKRGERQAPPEVERIFRVLRAAIDLGMRAARPGVQGFGVDEIVRGYITNAGYPDYGHATGHAIGELPHSPGVLLAPRRRPPAKLELQSNAVYTIEPRIAVENGGSIEEMVLVSEEGAVPLSPPQRSLYLVQ